MKAVRHQVSCEQPLVSVVVITYNHKKFIREAIDGVLMQETDFPVEIIIGEDCSTDGTRGILEDLQRTYPGAVRLLDSDRNLGANLNSERTKTAALGKYVAILEGDDFWTDKQKLALQVELMERHRECSLCFHPVTLLDDTSGHVEREWPVMEARSPFQGTESCVKLGNFIPTCSVMMRQSMQAQLPGSFDGFILGDWPMWLLTSLRGSVACIDSVMGCYRLHEGGVWTRASAHQRILAEAGMWERLLPMLPLGVAELARERLNSVYLSAFCLSEFSSLSARSGLALKWLWSAIRLGSVRRGDLGYVAGQIFPWLSKIRRFNLAHSITPQPK